MGSGYDFQCKLLFGFKKERNLFVFLGFFNALDHHSTIAEGSIRFRNNIWQLLGLSTKMGLIVDSQSSVGLHPILSIRGARERTIGWKRYKQKS